MAAMSVSDVAQPPSVVLGEGDVNYCMHRQNRAAVETQPISVNP
jgi:hypothetical protein